MWYYNAEKLAAIHHVMILPEKGKIPYKKIDR
jgi:hypothetical protein